MATDLVKKFQKKKVEEAPNRYYKKKIDALPEEIGEVSIMPEGIPEATDAFLAAWENRVKAAQEGGETITVHIERAEFKTIHKVISPLSVLEQAFLMDLEGRNKADSTINTYKKHFKRIYEFIRTYIDITDTETSVYVPSIPLQEIADKIPIAILEMDYFTTYYTRYMKAHEYKEQTIISSLRHFRAIYYFAAKHGWIEQKKIEIGNPLSPVKKTFSKEELEKMSVKPDKENFVDTRSWTIIQYLLSTGNRISSVIGLKVGDINFEDMSITVNVQKNKKPKTISLHHKLAKYLLDYIRVWRSDDDTGRPLLKEYLFCNRTGEQLSYEGIRDAMQDYFKEKGIDYEGFHKFRYSYAAFWIRDGGDGTMLQNQLGHSSYAMTQRYMGIFGTDNAKQVKDHSLINSVEPQQGRKAIKPRMGKK